MGEEEEEQEVEEEEREEREKDEKNQGQKFTENLLRECRSRSKQAKSNESN